MKPTPPPISSLGLWHRIHVRLTLLYAFALLLVLTPAAAFVYDLAVQAELESLWARIRMTAVSIADLVDGDRLAAATEAEDPYRAELFTRFRAIMTAEPELASIYVFAPTERPDRLRFLLDADLRAAPAAFGDLYDATLYPDLIDGIDGPSVEHDPVTDAWGVSISGFAPILGASGAQVAIVGVDVDAARVDRMKARLLRVALATYLGALLLLAIAAIGVGRVLRGPMTRIIRGTEAIAAGELSARVGLVRGDELGLLGAHFDRMAAGLEERDLIRATFGRYVSEEVARKLLTDQRDGLLAGEERAVTVLFSDLRGYTTLSEHLAPRALLALMNRYLEVMTATIDGQGGCVIELLGDGILAVFGAPDDLPDHAARAVRCAVAMRTALGELNAAWDADGTAVAWKSVGLTDLAARIGVHTGHVVAGSVGSHLRLKYAIIGDTVNLAARLEAMNTSLGTDILLSHDVYAVLPPDLAAAAVPRGDHPVKGRAQRVSVYSL